MMKSLVNLLETDVGFRTERLLTMDVSLAGEKYTSGENQAAFYEQVLHRLESLPSVLSVAATVDLPMTRNWTVERVRDSGRSSKTRLGSL